MIATDSIYQFAGDIESIIFDFDGVLVDSDVLHWRAYQWAFTPHGIAFSLNDYRTRAKGRSRDFVIDLFCSHLPQQDQERVALEKGEAAKRLLASGVIRPVEGVVNFIQSARKRDLLLAVASTSEIAGFAVEVLGIADLFDCVCAKQKDDLPKPHPDVFLRVLRELDTPAESCLVIEDTAVGAEAAHRAGTQVITRWVESESGGQKIPQNVIGSFSTYSALHEGLGWGSLGDQSP